MLKIEGLYKAFKDKKVLEGLDLVLNEGSIFGLVGVNGAGKSTLLRCIAGIYEADHGSVLFNARTSSLSATSRIIRSPPISGQ